MHKEYRLSDVGDFLNAECSINEPESRFNQISTDSRQIKHSQNTLFVAINGKNHDGHAFIENLLLKGVKNFVVNDPKWLGLKNANFILVQDSIQAFQKIVSWHRTQFKIPVFGITGSNGKTIVKEWLGQLLAPQFMICKSPKSYNSQIGVPLSVWALTDAHELGIFEAGISMPNEMEKLEKIIQPTHGIFTNIGDAHSENFTSKESKTTEKLKLFKNVETIIFCADHIEISTRIKNIYPKKNLVSWNLEGRGSLHFEVQTKENVSYLRFNKNEQSYDFQIPFTDYASIENICHCIVTCSELKIDLRFLKERLYRLSPISMRLELKQGVNNTVIINDAYSADLESLKIALEFTNQQNNYAKKTAILSSFEQSSIESNQLYTSINDLLHQAKFTQLIGIGKEIKKFGSIFSSFQTVFYSSTQEALEELHQGKISFSNESVLIKGARNYHFEKLTNFLQEQKNETLLEINLNQLVENLNTYRTLIQPNVKTMAMVKAYGYGSGSAEIARTLEHHGVNYFAVAYPDAGIALRKAGIRTPIMVMSPRIFSFQELIRWGLEPEISNLDILTKLDSAISKMSLQNPVCIHVKIETGMNRLGFRKENLAQLVEILRNNHSIKATSVFSHLAAADNPEEDHFTLNQIETFKQASDFLSDKLGYTITRHILNSAGIERFPQAQFDMVRLGIGLYGISSGGKLSENLKSIGTFKTTIIQLNQVKAGESIGYGRSEVLNSDETVAVVPVGYADGLNRKLSNGKGSLIVNGQIAPIVGKVCMDMTMIKVSNINAKVGDEVIIFNSEYPASRIAEQLETIPYEVLTSISARVKRVYFQE